jgi:hypothetical protein
MRRACLAVCLALLAPAAQAQMYKCVDANGRVHYSDKPQPGCKGGPVELQQIPTVPGQASTPQSGAQQDADFRRRQSERARQEANEKAAQTERCTRARQELEWLSSSGRLVEINDAGERVFLDEATRESRLARAKQQMRSCL